MIRFIRSICIILSVLSLAAFIGVSVYSERSLDNTAPVINMQEEEITVSTLDSTDMICNGITAVDDRDGDVTEFLTLEKLSNFISPGVRKATIAAFDNAGNVSRVTRTVNYSDYVSPRVKVTEPLRVPLNDTSSLLEKIIVTDCLDGDITENLQMVSEKTISTAVAGKYPMRLQVSNSAGDTIDLPVTVEFYNVSSEYDRPVIQLTDYLIYVEKGQKVDPLSYLKQLDLYTDVYVWNPDAEEFAVEESFDEDQEQGGEYYNTPAISIDEISIENPVDTSAPGTYEIQYRFENYENSRDTSVRLIVVVEERRESDAE